MKKGLKFIYFDDTEVVVDLPSDISVSLLLREKGDKIRVLRIYDESLSDKKYLINLFNEIDVENLKTVEYQLDNNTVNYITSYTFIKQYSLTDNIYGKITTPNTIYELIDIVKDVH